VLCGNKSDLEDQRVVKEEEARGLAEKYGWVFLWRKHFQCRHSHMNEQSQKGKIKGQSSAEGLGRCQMTTSHINLTSQGRLGVCPFSILLSSSLFWFLQSDSFECRFYQVFLRCKQETSRIRKSFYVQKEKQFF
jgi:hypothetical protein